jgi:hypothetical protein
LISSTKSMRSPSSTPRPVITLWQRAWSFSFVFHVAMCLLLGMFVQQAWRGAALQADYSPGIELRLSSDDVEVVPQQNQIVATIAAPPRPQPRPVEVQPAAPAPVEATTEAPRLPSPLASAIDAARNAQQSGGDRRARRGLRVGAIGDASQTEVSVFGVKGTGTKFVYLFDRSSSMEGSPLSAAKRQLIESLGSLDSVHQFQIIFFNSLPHAIDITGAGRMAFATDQNKRLAANIVGGITADLGTDRYLALKKAISFGPDVIFFLTDAEDEMLPSELAEIERANGRVGAAICVIEFGDSAPPLRENFLMRLARQSGGSYGYVNTLRLGQ